MKTEDSQRSADQVRPLILIVDDIIENRSIVKRRLERMGFDCALADGGRSALNSLLTLVPALILLDYMMPDINGLTVLREIRATPSLATLPVIMLTARTDSEAVARSLGEGADDYMQKPIDFLVLKARIDAQLARGTATRTLVEANGRLDVQAAARAIELSEVRELLHDEINRAQGLEDRLRHAAPGVPGDAVQAADHVRRIIGLVSGSELGSAPGPDGEMLRQIQSAAELAMHAIRKE